MTGHSAVIGPVPGDVAIADIAAGDLDADGDLDLVATAADQGPVAVLLARPTGPFWDERSLDPPDPARDRPGDVEIADLTGDGIADLVAVDRAHDALIVWVGDGHGGFLEPRRSRSTGRQRRSRWATSMATAGWISP